MMKLVKTFNMEYLITSDPYTTIENFIVVGIFDLPRWIICNYLGGKVIVNEIFIETVACPPQ
jgi:hypothetical protein